MAGKTKSIPAQPDDAKEAGSVILQDEVSPNTGENSQTGESNAAGDGGDASSAESSTDATSDVLGTGAEDEQSEADKASQNGTVVPQGAAVGRKAVVFLGPHHRYSRADMASFDEKTADVLVKRGIAVWPENAKHALSSRRGDDHDTDIG